MAWYHDKIIPLGWLVKLIWKLVTKRKKENDKSDS